jgi:signal transduction histidine kinase/CheY-like chemotaxis protein
VSLRRSDELNRRVIALQWVLAVAGALAIAVIFLGFIRQRRLNARLDQARSSAVQAHQEAERASAIKDQFLANMSHEIRTPLNGMMGMVQALRLSRLDPDQRAKLDILQASSQGVLSILNDLLDISKIEAGKLYLESAPFDPAAAVEEIVAVYRPAAEAKGLSLELSISADARGARLGDGLRWRQILGNLLSNAVKFTKEGAVAVSLTVEGEHLEQVVSDTGLGLDKNHLARVFDKFEQADPSTTRQFGGTGLGLAITRELILAMGGAISVDSALGVGSRFRVTLPLAQRTEAEAAIPVRAASAPPDLTLKTRRGGRLRILAAEDHEVNQLVLATLLRSLDCEVVMVADGAQAIAAFETGVWDVVLLDIQMPNVDGYAAVREIRAMEARRGLSRTPMVALTANIMVHQIEGYRAAGFDSELGKPIVLEALIEMLNKVARAARASSSNALAPNEGDQLAMQ